MIEFNDFPKMARLTREVIVTEKIDGTNSQVFIREIDKDNSFEHPFDIQIDGHYIRAGSRNRWISTVDDNYGFAKWVYENAYALQHLGTGHHYGEWWGSGIQRRYGMNDKVFSLFNVSRWENERPSCCRVVPVLYRGEFDTTKVSEILGNLNMYGSIAAPGFMNPEGVVVWHTAANIGFKKTIEKDELPKSKR